MNHLYCIFMLNLLFGRAVYVSTTNGCVQSCDERGGKNSSCWVHHGCNISFPASEFKCAGPPCNIRLTIAFTSVKSIQNTYNDVETEIGLYDLTKNVTVIKYFQMYFKFVRLDTSSPDSMKTYDFILDIDSVSTEDSGEFNVTIFDKYIGSIVLHHLYFLQVVQTSSNLPICDTKLLLHQALPSSVGFLLTCYIRKDYHSAEIEILTNTGCFYVASSSSNISWNAEALFVPVCEKTGYFICQATFSGKYNLPSHKNITENCTFDIERPLAVLSKAQESTAKGNNYVLDGISLALIFMMLAGCIAVYFYKKSKRKPLPLPVTKQEPIPKAIPQNNPVEPVPEAAVLRKNTKEVQDPELQKEANHYREMRASDLYDDCGNGNQLYYDHND